MLMSLARTELIEERCRQSAIGQQDNPPLLHQKDQLITENYPSYTKFSKLSQQERKWGLLEDPKAIFDRQAWERCLADRGTELRGHRVVWRKDATEYQKQAVAIHSHPEH